MEEKNMTAGMRVVVPEGATSKDLPIRTGTVLTCERGGGLVKHDDGNTYGWGAGEVEPIDFFPWYVRAWWWMKVMWTRAQSIAWRK